MNCDSCGYLNGPIAYVQAMGAGTEQYGCPIKHARKMKAIHNRHHKFMEYGDGIDYHRNHEALRRDFVDLRGGCSIQSPGSLTAYCGSWYYSRQGYSFRRPSSDR